MSLSSAISPTALVEASLCLVSVLRGIFLLCFEGCLACENHAAVIILEGFVWQHLLGVRLASAAVSVETKAELACVLMCF